LSSKEVIGSAPMRIKAREQMSIALLATVDAMSPRYW